MKDARVVVVGMGKSGIAAARLALARQARVVCMDQSESLADKLGELAVQGATLMLGPERGRDACTLDTADLVIVSPGVPDFAELRHAESDAHVPVIGELEFGVRERTQPPATCPIVAVGGTNGKSTVTTLVHQLLEAQGLRAFAGGNLGEPVSSVADTSFDALVLEVSSFQMERAPTFRPRVSILLNVTPDHLDRYASEAEYARAKGNAFVNQTAGDVAVVPAGDDVCTMQARRGRGALVTFGTQPGADIRITPDALVWHDGKTEEGVLRANVALSGEHNMQNACAAIAAARTLGVRGDTIRAVLSSFTGLAHRVAFVRELGGVRFYDDSKGTNVGAAIAALSGMREAHVVLIAGGKDKGGSYEPLVQALLAGGKGRACITLGEAAPLIEKALGARVPSERAATMEEAVVRAFARAQPGDAVLLSPACSSFDMFRDYAHRGDMFAAAARALPETVAPRGKL